MTASLESLFAEYRRHRTPALLGAVFDATASDLFRIAAHLYAKRRQDRLTFEVQEAIAPELVRDRDPAPARAVRVIRVTGEARAVPCSTTF